MRANASAFQHKSPLGQFVRHEIGDSGGRDCKPVIVHRCRPDGPPQPRQRGGGHCGAFDEANQIRIGSDAVESGRHGGQDKQADDGERLPDDMIDSADHPGGNPEQAAIPMVAPSAALAATDRRRSSVPSWRKAAR